MKVPFISEAAFPGIAVDSREKLPVAVSRKTVCLLRWSAVGRLFYIFPEVYKRIQNKLDNKQEVNYIFFV